MTERGAIFFLTDYGRRDGFVAVCHGVMLRIVPDVRIIDVTHDVPPQDVRHGAVVLAQTVPYLPPSVVVGVVDPGVGSRRRAVAVVVGEHVLVGPDNGLLVWAADTAGGVAEAVELTSPEYRLGGNAITFHGRDIFAPAAAHLAAGVPMRELGPAVPPDALVRLPDPVVRVRDGGVQAEVHVVDHFGNVSLAARAADLDRAGVTVGDRLDVVVGARSGSSGNEGDSSTGEPSVYRARVCRIFADVAPGELLAYVDSYGYAALAVSQGNAAGRLGVVPGDAVTLRVRGT